MFARPGAAKLEGEREPTSGDGRCPRGDSECTRRAAELAARAIEEACPPSVLEICVTAEFVVLLSRPSLHSTVVGVLQRHDVVTAALWCDEAGDDRWDLAAAAGFWRVPAGSWIRHKSDWESFFQSRAESWVLWRLPGAGRPCVSRVELPQKCLQLEVTRPQATSHACRQEGSEAVQIWQQGEVVGIAEELPCGWLRVVHRATGRGARHEAPTRSSFMLARCGEIIRDDDPQSAGEKCADVDTQTPAGSIADCGSCSCSSNEDQTSDAAAEPHTGAPAEHAPLEDVGPVAGTPGDRTDTRQPTSGPPAGSPGAGSQEPVASVATPATTAGRPVCGNLDQAPSPTRRRRPAVYFGICDLKYDPRRPAGSRVRVLELGDHKTSRFSGCGQNIVQEFERRFRIPPHATLHRGCLVDNKKMTNDWFVDCGYGNLRPKQCSYPREYTDDLAARIEKELAPGEDEPVVLKLINRTRGAGVVVVHPRDLDSTLRQLLKPPDIEDIEFTLPAALAVANSPTLTLDESCLHWWSNESPIFVVEKCEQSHPVWRDDEGYDATMRIGFVLMNDDDDDTGLLKVEFLGGYWKLPLAPVHSGDPQARCVSNRRSGTLPVPAHELDDVYSELRPVLPKIFAYEQYGPQAYMPKYKGEVFMSVYCLIRGAAEARARKHKNAHTLLVNAEDLLVASDSRLRRPLLKHGSSPGPTSVPMRALVAYWLRQAGIERQCTGAPGTQEVVATAACFQRALELHPWNAGAEYLLGLIAISKGELEDARVHFVRSLRIDPEFKALYICLGSVALTLGDLDDAVRISEVGLRRYPQAFQCYYNLGLALARQLSKQLHARPTGGGRGHEGTCQDLQGLASRSVGQLRQAKQEHQGKLWCASDDAILKTLEAIVGALGRGGGAAAIDRPADSDRELHRELATQLLCAKGWTLETFRP